MPAAKKKPAFTIRPLTPARWKDLEKLFGKNGACGGCWCMWWKLPRKDWVRGKSGGNKRAFMQEVKKGPPPGLLAYAGREVVGWIAFAPRTAYPRLAKSRVMAPLDDQPVWSVTCFFVAKAYRRKGLTVALLKAAGDFAKKKGARILEGYPTDARSKAEPSPFIFTGITPAFTKAGFREAARRSPTRPLMRKTLR